LPLYPGRKFPFVAALAAYLDESFEERARIYAIGGYIADPDLWDAEFQVAWRRCVIDSAPHKVSEFKASDSAGGWGEFANKWGWTKAQRQAFYRTGVEVISQCGSRDQVHGFGAAVRFRVEDMEKFEHFGFGVCLFHVLEDALRTAGRALGPDDELQVVVDEKPKFAELTDCHFGWVRDWLRKESALPCDLPMPVRRDSRKVAALQAADLLAYEVLKEAKSRVDGSNRDVRGSLRALTEAHYHSARALHWEQALEAKRRVEAGEPTDNLGARVLFASGEPWRAADQWPND